MSYPAPRVSILIPNFNNGIASSSDGQTDLLGDLLQSLFDTLKDDPTPLEIIAYDDGSTDDSLDTLRQWSKKTWRDDQPFLTLIEEKHTGVLSIGANHLVRASKGDILVRLDGDTQMLTENWASILCQTFDQAPPRLGVVGPKQLRLDGKIHAFGDWLLHPKGYHHILAGAERNSVTQAMEVDHVMGCFYCCKRKVYEDVGGYDESILRGQTIDFGLAARLKGWSCWAIPQIEYIHRHGLRGARQTTADTSRGVKQTLDTFRRKWGFDRIAPDLDVVRDKFRGTPLLWNAQVFGFPPAKKVSDTVLAPEPFPIEQSQWTRYAQDAGYKQAVNLRVSIALQVIAQIGKPKTLAVLGCDAGLTPHLLAGQGLTCLATDPDPAKIALADQCITHQSYPAQKPEFFHQSDPQRFPLEDGSANMALLFDQLECHPNPVGLLNDIHRLLAKDGKLILVTKRPHQAGAYQELDRCYRPHELIAQFNAVGGWQPLSDPRQGDPSHPSILIAKRITKPEANTQPAAAAEAA